MTAQMCENHWKLLKTQIAAEGLSGLVARDDGDMKRRLGAELPRARFEPLFGANMAIISKSIEVLGFEPFMAQGQTVCPLCAVQSMHEGKCSVVGCTWKAEEEWIARSCELMHEQAVELGLIAKA